jgi:hypothetical protein
MHFTPPAESKSHPCFLPCLCTCTSLLQRADHTHFLPYPCTFTSLFLQRANHTLASCHTCAHALHSCREQIILTSCHTRAHALHSSCREQITPSLPAIPVRMHFTPLSESKSHPHFLPYLCTCTSLLLQRANHTLASCHTCTHARHSSCREQITTTLPAIPVHV